MRKFLLLVLFIPTLLWAQEDQKYLAGAIPEVNGKVVFSKEVSVPTLTKDQIFDYMLSWAEGKFKDENNRVVYSDKEKGDIAAVGEAYIVFQSTALSLDRALMNYRITIECENHICKIMMSSIRYEYNVSYQKEPEKYAAEDWITDQYALHKNKKKLNRGYGKFRKKTIDFAEKTLNEAAFALGVQEAKADGKTIPATALTPASINKTMTGFVSFTVDQIPATILQLLPESALEIVSDKDKSVKETKGNWKGIGKMLGKNIASVSVDEDSQVCKALKDNDVYSISFTKKEGSNEGPWLIIECRKQGETADGGQKTIVGEITNIWIK